ncbi:hypothetical protein H2203_003128 [Taxawa tesnikishii (nom. ined.)]|nr:hypothetical protein H2203_003128 [Dothideales sp. JES 119]
MILNSIAISPLELTALGLLSRVLSSINKAKTTTVTTRHVKLMETVLTVALVLGIVGGDLASDDYAKTGVYQTHVLSKASIGLMIAAFVGIVLFTLATSREVSSAEAGEKRILLAIAASLPFLLIRIIYSAVYTFTNAKSFSAMSGSVAIMLCMAVIEELVVVWIYLGVGLTLKKATKSEEVSDEYRELGTMTGYQPCGPAAKSVSVEGSRV